MLKIIDMPQVIQPGGPGIMNSKLETFKLDSILSESKVLDDYFPYTYITFKKWNLQDKVWVKK